MSEMTSKKARINLQVGELGAQNEIVEFDLRIHGDVVYKPSVIDGLAQAIRKEADAYLEDGGERSWLDALGKWAFHQDSIAPAREPSAFEQNVRRVTADLAELLIAKNKAYSNSALDPVRILSKADPLEQLYVRADDKLSRLARGHEYPGDDTLRDLCGYLILILIAKESA